VSCHWSSRLLIVAAILLGGTVQAKDVSNTLRWTVQNPLGTYGYIVYRSDREAGPFQRLSVRFLAPQADGRQEYVDQAVVEGRTYYYRIDAVSDKGFKKQLSPVLQKRTGGKRADAELPAQKKP
jgi:hypothetical protein